jgi:2-polyprenyl-3-methyl-5-hydroxy-6-metoxy-1,4-benzoquinol methylase
MSEVTDGQGLSRYHVESVDEDGKHSQSKVLDLVPAHARVLDLGCSTGGLAAAMARKGCEVTGLDLNLADAAAATGRMRRVVVADLDTEDLSQLLPGESFDVIVAADVLEHLSDPARVLRSVRDFMAPGGFVVFSIPNVAHASVRLALWHGDFPYGPFGILDRTHLRMFTRTSIEELFSESGFSVDSVGRVLLPLEDGVPHTTRNVPRRMLQEMLKDAEALTKQFVGRAFPVGDRTELPRHPPRAARSKEAMLIEAQAQLLATQNQQLESLNAYYRRVERSPLRRIRRQLQRGRRLVSSLGALLPPRP